MATYESPFGESILASVFSGDRLAARRQMAEMETQHFQEEEARQAQDLQLEMDNAKFNQTIDDYTNTAAIRQKDKDMYQELSDDYQLKIRNNLNMYNGDWSRFIKAGGWKIMNEYRDEILNGELTDQVKLNGAAYKKIFTATSGDHAHLIPNRTVRELNDWNNGTTDTLVYRGLLGEVKIDENKFPKDHVITAEDVYEYVDGNGISAALTIDSNMLKEGFTREQVNNPIIRNGYINSNIINIGRPGKGKIEIQMGGKINQMQVGMNGTDDMGNYKVATGYQTMSPDGKRGSTFKQRLEGSGVLIPVENYLGYNPNITAHRHTTRLGFPTSAASQRFKTGKGWAIETSGAIAEEKIDKFVTSKWGDKAVFNEKLGKWVITGASVDLFDSKGSETEKGFYAGLGQTGDTGGEWYDKDMIVNHLFYAQLIDVTDPDTGDRTRRLVANFENPKEQQRLSQLAKGTRADIVMVAELIDEDSAFGIAETTGKGKSWWKKSLLKIEDMLDPDDYYYNIISDARSPKNGFNLITTKDLNKQFDNDEISSTLDYSFDQDKKIQKQKIANNKERVALNSISNSYLDGDIQSTETVLKSYYPTLDAQIKSTGSKPELTASIMAQLFADAFKAAPKTEVKQNGKVVSVPDKKAAISLLEQLIINFPSIVNQSEMSDYKKFLQNGNVADFHQYLKSSGTYSDNELDQIKKFRNNMVRIQNRYIVEANQKASE